MDEEEDLQVLNVYVIYAFYIQDITLCLKLQVWPMAQSYPLQVEHRLCQWKWEDDSESDIPLASTMRPLVQWLLAICMDW